MTSNTDSNPSLGSRIARAGADPLHGIAAKLTRALARHQLLEEPPPMLGRYHVRRRIGGGGMAVVFEGWDPQLARSVAVKVLHADPSSSVVDITHEARILAQLSDPAIVTVYDLGVEDEQVYVCMALVDGGDVARWLAARGAVAWSRIVGWFADAARGLHVAHEANIIHRDFKLENLLIGSDGLARVTDFGLARFAGRRGDVDASAAERADPHTEVPLAPPATWSGIAGTPGYIAPEIEAGRPANARSDQWSFFVALDRALAYAESTPPSELATMIVRGTDPEPERRYPDLATIEGLLRELLVDDDDPVASRSGSRARQRRAHESSPASAGGVLTPVEPWPNLGSRPSESTPAALARLLEIATRSRSREDFRQEALAWIDRHVGYDTALFGQPDGQGTDAPTILNFDPAFVAQFAAQPERYAPTLTKIVAAAAMSAAPLRDVDVYGLSERDKTPFYTELIGRKGSKVMMIGALTLGAELRGTLQISRASRGAQFRDGELALIQQALPILALGEGVHPGVLSTALPSLTHPDAPPTREPPRLSKREAEVLDYLALGLSNGEIALACGLSIDAVRGHVAALLRKFGARNRRALSLGLRAGVSTPRRAG